MSKEIKFAPREVFEKILEFAVIPTFDLVIEIPEKGVLIVKRRIAPYANQWALPGLRMFKPESIEDTLERISKQETGLIINPKERFFLGQFIGRFKTEHQRQDISTGYAVIAKSSEVIINKDHFSGYKIIRKRNETPSNVGAMYRFYLNKYFETKR